MTYHDFLRRKMCFLPLKSNHNLSLYQASTIAAYLVQPGWVTACIWATWGSAAPWHLSVFSHETQKKNSFSSSTQYEPRWCVLCKATVFVGTSRDSRYRKEWLIIIPRLEVFSSSMNSCKLTVPCILPSPDSIKRIKPAIQACATQASDRRFLTMHNGPLFRGKLNHRLHM